jgi:hypothetical protein
MNGANMGINHYERTSATRILENISTKMHSTLLKHLKLESNPISILLDTSTDAGNQNHLFIYLRTLENHWPQTYFYRCLKVKKESPSDLLNFIVDAFNNDDIYDTVTSNLVGFASDGSPIMLGRHSGLSKLMNGISKHKLYEVHCFAHRLQLAVRHSFKNVRGMEENFEKFINNIYSFYNDKSFKRKESLKTTAEALGEQFWELNYIFTIRWLSSELSALSRLHKNYNSLIHNMDNISKRCEFSEEIAIKASAYKEILLNPKFHTTLLFVIDVLQLLNGVSKSFQDSSSTVIGKEELRAQIMNNLEKLKSENGEKINNLVKQSKCLKLGMWVTCTTSDLDTCNFKLLKQGTTIVFTTPQSLRQRSDWMKLSDLRSNLLML